MIFGKSGIWRATLSLFLLVGVWFETGWFTTIALGLVIIGHEIHTYMWQAMIDAKDRDNWIERIRRLS